MQACLSCDNKNALNNEATPMIIKDNVSMHQNTKRDYSCSLMMR